MVVVCARPHGHLAKPRSTCCYVVYGDMYIYIYVYIYVQNYIYIYVHICIRTHVCLPSYKKVAFGYTRICPDIYIYKKRMC